ncbi:DUF1838 family protein [Streptomyces sp. NPDC097619]|uniref:DUF1838 family protein n=1 Tax=Streptomyces sp. NPDC097619 TaxID=3157228 RepID=UPI00332271BD
MTFTPAELLTAFARTRASLDGRETVYAWMGDVYAHGPAEPYRRIFGFEGFNVSRLVPAAEEDGGGLRLLSREAAFYLDPSDRRILEEWEGRPVEHVWNDPVNQHWRPFPVPYTLLGDQVCFSLEIPLAYPSPLPVAQYPENSADDTYRALEMFQFFAPAEVFDTTAPGVPATMSWTRMSPWLPWMARGQRPGGLVFQCRGRKLEGYGELPERIRAHVAAHRPEYAAAPEEWSAPNESTWTAFRRTHPPRES